MERTVPSEFNCPCGREHRSDLKETVIGSGVIARLPELIKKYGGTKPFIYDDANTRSAAGERVREFLGDMKYSAHTFKDAHLLPDNSAVGSALMHFDKSCDMVIAVGSGVIGDISKIIANIANVPMITVATAPSMDGFASATSSMCLDGLKISLPSKVPVAIVADTDIIKEAPARMLASGVGDMAAKYISLCEWKISHILNGEYYCEDIARIMRSALDKVAANAEGLAKRDPEAVAAVTEGLILAGQAMSWAGVSRPASGIEHYISHVWDMRAEEFGTPSDFHGIQCGVGTLIALRLYEHIRTLNPSIGRATEHAAAFDREAHFELLRKLFGKGAESMIAAEAKDKKYDIREHAKRIDVILFHWDEICAVMDDMLPTYEYVEKLLRTVGAPTTADELGLGDSVGFALEASKDIRYKYIASHLLWDIGEEIPEIK